jgi:Bacterial PH domain
VSDHEGEPIPGLPAALPEGETILWQGAPDWRSLARRAFHVRLLAGYFVLLIGWRIAVAFGDASVPAVSALAGPVILALVAMGLVSMLAFLTARSTVYTITSRRVIVRSGVALPVTVNYPFPVVTAVDLNEFADGHGDVSIAIVRSERIGFLLNWPHVRPWHINHPQPTLRSIAASRQVGELLADAASRSFVSSATTSLPSAGVVA